MHIHAVCQITMEELPSRIDSCGRHTSDTDDGLQTLSDVSRACRHKIMHMSDEVVDSNPYRYFFCFSLILSFSF